MSLGTDGVSGSEATDGSPERSTDDFFGFVVGLYAATLLAPAAAVAVALGVSTDPGVLFFAVLGTVVAAVSGVGYLARSDRLAVRLGATRWVWAAPVVPFGYAGLFVVGSGTVPAAGAGVSLLGMVVGMFVGMGLAVAAGNRYAKAVLADAGEHARFSAKGPDRDRRVVTWAVAVLMGAGVVGLAVSALAPEFETGRWLFHLLVGGGAALMGAATERTVAVTDAGLLVGNPIHKRVRPWSEFEGYSLAEDALVLHRAGWSAWGLRDVRCNPDDIEDLAAVEDALDRYLPRR